MLFNSSRPVQSYDMQQASVKTDATHRSGRVQQGHGGRASNGKRLPRHDGCGGNSLQSTSLKPPRNVNEIVEAHLSLSRGGMKQVAMAQLTTHA